MSSAKQWDAALADFRIFVWLVWKHLGLPDPTEKQYEIANYLQEGPRRLVVCAFRGVGKSWITSAFVLWQLLNNPQLKILVVSASKDRSDAFSTFTKRLINEMPALNHLRPDPMRDQRDSNIAFDVGPSRPAHSPSVKSVGVYGQMTGSRADVIVFDDAEVPNNSETATQRAKLRSRVAEGGAAVLSPGGRVVYLGTPQTEESLYNALPEMGYEVRMWPAEIPEDLLAYGDKLAPSIALAMAEGVAPGTPTDPNRFNVFELSERKAEYGRSGYLLQYMLDTSLSDELRFPLKTSDLIVMPTDVDTFPNRVVWAGDSDNTIEYLPQVGFAGDHFQKPMHMDKDWSPYTMSLMYVDPAGRGKDEVGWVVAKFLHGMIVIRRWGGLRGGYDEPTLAKLATIARDEKVNLVLAEDNFGDGMWIELFKPVLRRIYVETNPDGTVKRDGEAGCRVEGERVGPVQKEVRVIDSLEPAMGSHRIIFDEALVKAECRPKIDASDPHAALKNGFFQMTHISKDRGSLRFDDRIDVLAGAVRYFTANLGQDVNEQAKEARNAKLEEALDDFVEGLTGHRQPKTWSGAVRPS